uniref:Uncharacterized protein n=1 Tax=Leptospira santarosai serovar Arenal str. MAVJ 401 TaxID=1049976 RepID=M6JU11_9LEPT|nr:hypothetical protein LEP1GSC063_3258 [Leptospira santarosai serovar Arenal str. MAVJ 401]
MSKEQATAILDARAQEESKAAQNKNNQETGKSVLDGAAISTQRREDGDGDSADPVDQRINQLKRELSEGILLADGNGSMSDADGGSGVAGAAKELSKKMAELQQLESHKAAGQKPGVQKDGSIVVVGSKENMHEAKIVDGSKASTHADLKPGEIGYSILNFSAVLGVGPNLTKTEMTDHTGRTTVSWDVGVSFGLGGGISYSEGKVEGLHQNVKAKDFSFDLGMNVGLGVASVDFNFYNRSKVSASLGGARALPTIPGKIGVTVTPGSGQGYPQWTISKWDKRIQNENE